MYMSVNVNSPNNDCKALIYVGTIFPRSMQLNMQAFIHVGNEDGIIPNMVNCRF